MWGDGIGPDRRLVLPMVALWFFSTWCPLCCYNSPETRDLISPSMFALLDGLDYELHSSLVLNSSVALSVTKGDDDLDSFHFTLSHCNSPSSGGVELP